MGDVRVGISGWRYPPWRGVFYPKGLPQRRELEYASARFRTIEINGSFYALQRPEYYAGWADQTPEDFVFSVKGPRYITHMRNLVDVELPLANFFASGVLALGRKLGPVLWQLPPRLRFDSARLAAFFDLLPRTTTDAAALAQRHEPRLDGRALTRADAHRPVRHALEVRHESFVDVAFVESLRRHDVALVVADTAGKWPLLADVTADLVYVRLHGDTELYVSGYDEAAIDAWAARVQSFAGGGEAPGARTVGPSPAPRPGNRDVFVYFDNDVKARAPFDALALAARLGVAAGG